MITIQEFLDCINFSITGGSEFNWKCFGPNARYLEHDTDALSTHIIFDTVTQEVYMMETWDNYNDREYRMISPYFAGEYFRECESRGAEFNRSIDGRKFRDIDNVADIMHITASIFNGEEYDTRATMDIEIDDGHMFELMKIAHERDITLNQLIEIILQQIIEDYSDKDED